MALAPLPFGSNDPISLSVWCLVLAVGLAFAPTARLGTHGFRVLLGAGFVALGYAVVIHEQLSRTPWLASVDPVWIRSAAILDFPVDPRASEVRFEPLFSMGNVIACLSTVALGSIVGSNARQARRAIKVVAWSGLCYAIYGIVAALFEPTMILWLERPGYVGNAIGTFINRNTAASYFGCCATLWLLLLCEGIRNRLPDRSFSWQRLRRGIIDRPSRTIVIRFVGTVVCLVALLMTNSRAGVLISVAVMTGCVLAMFWADLAGRMRSIHLVFVSAGVAFVALQIVGGSLDQRFNTSGLSDEGRFDIYRATARLIVDHPWLGTGAGTFVWAFPSYREMPPDIWGIWSMAHSTPVETAAELGLPFAGLVACVYLHVLWMLASGARRRDRVVPLAGAAALAIGLTHSCLDFSFQIPGFAIVIMGLLGVSLAQSAPAPTGCAC